MKRARSALAAAILIALPVAAPLAQMYGTSPFQNGTTGTPQAGLQRFDPDTGASTCFDDMGTIVCPGGLSVNLPGFTVVGVNSIKIDPTDGTDPNDPTDSANVAYSIIRISGVAGRVLALIDLDTGNVTEIGNLGDNFSSLTFDSNGNLYGVTGDGATVPETLYAIDKATAAKTLIGALGNGADGEVIEFNPSDGLFYHWSGNGTVVFERFELVPNDPNPPSIANLTNLPITGAPGGETFGAVWDPCTNEIIASNIASRFLRWTIDTPGPGATAGAQFGNNPDDMRGLALVGLNTCDVDLRTSLAVDNPVPAASDVITITADVGNAGPARAISTLVRFTLPPSLTYLPPDPDLSGCTQPVAGVVECPIVGSMGAAVFKNDLIQRSITATSDGGVGLITAESLSQSDETAPPDNTAGFLLGVDLFRDGFEDLVP